MHYFLLGSTICHKGVLFAMRGELFPIRTHKGGHFYCVRAQIGYLLLLLIVLPPFCLKKSDKVLSVCPHTIKNAPFSRGHKMGIITLQGAQRLEFLLYIRHKGGYHFSVLGRKWENYYC